jgi:mono/diheme cytochrome c family protein
MRKIVLLVASAALLLPAGAGAAGDPESGRELADRWCATCHAVGRPQTATDAAPAFATIAQHGRAEPGRLRAWLAEPHPPMPNPGLSRQQIEDVIAYLQRLGGP